MPAPRRWLAGAALPLVAAGLLLASTPPSPTPPAALGPGTAVWADSVLATLSLSDRVGQLFVTHAAATPEGLSGEEWARLVRAVRDEGVGGVLFLRGDAARQAEATARLQALARVPLLVAQDMEHGAGMRLPDATAFPNAMALGAGRQADLARAMGRAVAAEARALGVHQNYAPVADVNANPRNPIINVRAFGERPALVAVLATAYAQGMQEGGLLATAKHFPGHGDTDADSHAELPRLPFSRARLDAVELLPFRRAIEGGVMSVMVGHLAVPALDPTPGLPATLSRPIVTGLLRQALGFEGLIVTDGLDMRGITDQFPTGEIAVRALEAGADQLVMTRADSAAKAAVLDAVRTGRLSEARIDASVRRVLRAKAWAGLDRPARPRPAVPGATLRARHAELAAEIARSGLTLLRNDGQLLPFAGPRAPRRVLTLALYDGSPEPSDTFERAVAANARRLGAVAEARRLSADHSPAAFRDALRMARGADVVLVGAAVRPRSGSGRIALPEAHARLVERLIEARAPVVLVAFGSPYVVGALPEAPAAYLVGYGATAEVQRAAADAIFGRAVVSGQLPVTIPGLYAYDAGLRLGGPKAAVPAPSSLLPAPVAIPAATPESATLQPGAPAEAGMHAGVEADVARIVEAAIADRVFPGAAVAFGRVTGGRGVLVGRAGYGAFTYEGGPAITPASVFDLASLTKVVGTTAAVMRLVDDERLDLDAPVVRYLPAFASGPDAAQKRLVTVRHLLTHRAGHRPFRPFHTEGPTEPAAILDWIHHDALQQPPGGEAVYSDFDFVVLGEVVEAVTGQRLDAFLQAELFGPLGMAATGFRGVGTSYPSVVPTEVDWTFRRRLVQGEVHDEAAWLLGGTAGHAGLFSSADDLARFAFVLLNGGAGYGRRLFREETVRRFRQRVSTGGTYPMALGWFARDPQSDAYSSAGRVMGPNSVGHTGFTGTSLWMDPDSGVFVILLTNRVHPSRDGTGIAAVRAAVADAVAGAVVGPMPRN